MQKSVCAGCNSSFGLNELFSINGVNCCESCANAKLEQMQQAGEPQPEVLRLVDPSVCVLCGSDADLSRPDAITPICMMCAEKVYHRDFPAWLKLALAGALVVLVFALVHGSKYFRAGIDLYRAEKQVKARQYEPAITALNPVVAMAPQCEKCVLLLSLAQLNAGLPEAAWETTKAHNGGNFSDSEGALVVQVTAAYKRLDRAAEQVDKAQEFAKQGNDQEAWKALQSARRIYPEWKTLAMVEPQYEAGFAFSQGNFDRFLEIEREQAERYPDEPMMIAGLASAQACKFAETGNETFRSAALSSLEKAKSLSAASKDDMAEYEEYAERINYRLKTRQVINTVEYNRRFHPEKLKAAK